MALSLGGLRKMFVQFSQIDDGVGRVGCRPASPLTQRRQTFRSRAATVYGEGDKPTVLIRGLPKKLLRGFEQLGKTRR